MGVDEWAGSLRGLDGPGLVWADGPVTTGPMTLVGGLGSSLSTSLSTCI